MSSSSSTTYRTPVFVGLVCVMCFTVVLLLHHCVLVVFCKNRRRRRQQGQHHQQQQEQHEEEEDRHSVDAGSSSRVHLVNAAAAVVCPYRKTTGAWTESTCPVCLADFVDGEAVRVLPECMHYFHAECIDTWLRGSTSCPMCRAETTPSTPTPSTHDLSVSLDEILVQTEQRQA